MSSCVSSPSLPFALIDSLGFFVFSNCPSVEQILNLQWSKTQQNFLFRMGKIVVTFRKHWITTVAPLFGLWEPYSNFLIRYINNAH